ncbi:IS110 family transposase [Clostridium frigidicarnis]|uniref:Transposase n=1 Tax=Clostridium frigidicarnis TaxID=84698 RepID=A0A1I1B4B9_9CLOT|nr:transposase [Clostridium frigidicarnis]SFB44612.1 Transposase [Clostridium frigidicarnis]
MNKFTFNFVVGIDISSKSSVITILMPTREPYGKKLIITTNLVGFTKLHKILDDIYVKYSTKPKLFMESTGLYTIILYKYFTKSRFECYVINPIKTKNFAKQSIRKIKMIR